MLAWLCKRCCRWFVQLTLGYASCVCIARYAWIICMVEWDLIWFDLLGRWSPACSMHACPESGLAIPQCLPDDAICKPCYLHQEVIQEVHPKIHHCTPVKPKWLQKKWWQGTCTFHQIHMITWCPCLLDVSGWPAGIDDGSHPDVNKKNQLVDIYIMAPPSLSPA